MTRTELTERLLALPGEIADAEGGLLEATGKHRTARLGLAAEEAHHIRKGVPGKNAEERAAHLHFQLDLEREEVETCWREMESERIDVQRLRDEQANLRVVAGLIGGQA